MYNSFPYFLSMNTTQMSILILFKSTQKYLFNAKNLVSQLAYLSISNKDI